MAYSVQFVTKTKTIALRAGERERMLHIAINLTLGVIADMITWVYDQQGEELWIERYLPKDSELRPMLRNPMFHELFRAHMHANVLSQGLVIHNHPIEYFPFVLNTLVQMGSPALKFCARVLGECEENTWWSEEMHANIARYIYQGLQIGIFSKSGNWQNVMMMLSETEDTTCVLAVEQHKPFPSSTWVPEYAQAKYAHAPAPTQYEMCLESFQDAASHLTAFSLDHDMYFPGHSAWTMLAEYMEAVPYADDSSR